MREAGRARDGDVDVLDVPMSHEPAPAHPPPDMNRWLTMPSYAGPFNLLGYPALALPSRFSSEIGLPLSAQIVGARSPKRCSCAWAVSVSR